MTIWWAAILAWLETTSTCPSTAITWLRMPWTCLEIWKTVNCFTQNIPPMIYICLQFPTKNRYMKTTTMGTLWILMPIRIITNKSSPNKTPLYETINNNVDLLDTSSMRDENSCILDSRICKENHISRLSMKRKMESDCVETPFKCPTQAIHKVPKPEKRYTPSSFRKSQCTHSTTKTQLHSTPCRSKPDEPQHSPSESQCISLQSQTTVASSTSFDVSDAKSTMSSCSSRNGRGKLNFLGLCLEFSCVFEEVENLVTLSHPDEKYCGIVNSRLLTSEFYALRNQKLIFLHLFTDLFCKDISPLKNNSRCLR